MENFTTEEIRDLLISIVALIVIFSWKPFPNYGIDVSILPASALIIVIAFVLHEMAHKFAANKLGLIANYRMWPQALLFGLILMIFGIRFAAPGAVVVHSYRYARWPMRMKNIQASEMGIVATMGPLTNIIIAIIGTLFTGPFFKSLVFINAWLALINILPIPPLDGSKILRWKFWVWGFMFFLSLILIFLTLF